MKAIVSQMQVGDMTQVAEIEREAFSTSWPPTSFRREINNRSYSCLVAYAPQQQAALEEERGPASDLSAGAPGRSVFGRLLESVKEFVSPEVASDGNRRVLGYVSLWFGVEEAHVTAIAVGHEWRSLGIGDLLMIGAVEVARRRGSRFLSLEVRASNTTAQSLYSKYGFKKTGLRKGYYSDNREDALVMTTDPIDGPQYQEMVERLKESYRRKRGEFELALA